MTDIHCHILPGVDDGAQTMEEALEMARMAAAGGVTTLVATPHTNLPGAPHQNHISLDLQRRFYALIKAVKGAGIPLNILPGAEVMGNSDLPALLEQDKLLTLGGSRYLLVEFPFDEGLLTMDRLLTAITQRGCVPVIAHPERYEEVQQDLAIAEDWVAAGYVIQVNRDSLLGRLGPGAQRTAQRLLRHKLAHAVASDAHSPRSRHPRLDEGAEVLSQLCDPGYIRLLLEENPAHILADRLLPPIQ